MCQLFEVHHNWNRLARTKPIFLLNVNGDSPREVNEWASNKGPTYSLSKKFGRCLEVPFIYGNITWHVQPLPSIIRMMESGDDFCGPVNIGNPGEFTMLELAEKVIDMTGSKSKIVFRPLPSDDPKKRRPDITLAKSKLEWEPKVKLDQGLEKTIDYFKGTL